MTAAAGISSPRRATPYERQIDTARSWSSTETTPTGRSSRRYSTVPACGPSRSPGRTGARGGATRTPGTCPPRRLPRRHQRLRDLPRARETFGDDLPIIFTFGRAGRSARPHCGTHARRRRLHVKPYYPDELLARVRRFVTRARRLYFTPQARYELTPRELGSPAASRPRKSACGHRG